MLRCPHCHTPLARLEKQFKCPNGHSFDIGKAGDVNLLRVQQKRSKNPGDSKAMVAARRDFLASGVYQPIAERLAGIVTALTGGEPAVIADAGCGEGYYTRTIKRLAFPSTAYFNAHGGALIGWDISKYAVQSAAKQFSQLGVSSEERSQLAATGTWITASNVSIPLGDTCVDILMCGFGFEVADEFWRILKESERSGFLITLDAGEHHLIELRNIIYDTIKPHTEKAYLDEQLFTVVKQQRISYSVTITHEQLQQLMTMTPHLYRATTAGKERLAATRELSLTIDVLLRVYKKNPQK